MKILTVSDIHSDYTAIRYISGDVNPDLVLDCGDHERIENFTGLIPHYFVQGNHEPDSVFIGHSDLSHPHRISSGVVYRYIKDNEELRFAGIGGNYSSKPGDFSVRDTDLEAMSKIGEGNVDVLMFHESPYNVIPDGEGEKSQESTNDNSNVRLARRMISEIDRIKPRIVLSGHTGIKGDTERDEVKHIVLPGIAYGYGLLSFDGNKFVYEGKTLRWR